MIPICVTAQFDIEGDVFPISFTLKGVQFSIDTIGRKWQDEKGNHFLVMVPSKRVYELLFVPKEMCWYQVPYGMQKRTTPA
jgi:hypothetical protein